MNEGRHGSNKKITIIVCAALVLALAIGIIVGVSMNKGGKKKNAKDDAGTLMPGSTSQQVISIPDTPPQTSAPPPVVQEPEPEPEPEPDSSEPEDEEDDEKDPDESGPLEFISEPKVGSIDGKTVTVEFKTNKEATVNAIVSTSDTAPGISGFYDYYSRGKENEDFVNKQSVYMVTQDGTTATFEIPDKKESYYLILNAVDNETGDWQPNVTVITLYTP